MVKRYDLEVCDGESGSCHAKMVLDDRGDYVETEDYDALRDQVVIKQTTIENLNARLAEAEREQDDMHRVRLLLYAERDALRAQLAEARDARDLAEGKLIAHERMAERIHTYCRELSDAENVRLTGYEPWEAWLELDGALAELRRVIADSAGRHNPHQGLCDWANGLTDDSPFRTADSASESRDG